MVNRNCISLFTIDHLLFTFFCCRRKNLTSDRRQAKTSSYLVTCHLSLVTRKAGGDGRIRTCDGLLTHNGLANRRLQPLGHISAPLKAKKYSNGRRRIVKRGE